MHKHTHTLSCICTRSCPNHMETFQCRVLVKAGEFPSDYSLWVISICEQAHTHTESLLQTGDHLVTISQGQGLKSLCLQRTGEYSWRGRRGRKKDWVGLEKRLIQPHFIMHSSVCLELARHSAVTDVVTLSCPIQYGAFPWRYFKTTLLEGVHSHSCTSIDLMWCKKHSR